MAKKKKSKKKTYGVTKRPLNERIPDVSAKTNPFDLHFNKIKRNVVGRKITKSEYGRPTKSRHDAVNKRKKTLMQEYLNRDRAGQVLDKRIKDELGGQAKRKAKIIDMKMKESSSGGSKLTFSKQEFIDEDNLLNRRPVNNDEEDNDLNLLRRPEHIESAPHDAGHQSRHYNQGIKRSKELSIEDFKEEKRRRQIEQEMNWSLTEKLDEEWKEVRFLLNIGKESHRSDKKKAMDSKESKEGEDESTTINQLLSRLRSGNNNEGEKKKEVQQGSCVDNDDEADLNRQYDTLYHELMFGSKVNTGSAKKEVNQSRGQETASTSLSTGPQARARKTREEKQAERQKIKQESVLKRQKVIKRLRGKDVVIFPLIEPKLLPGLTVKKDPIKKLQKKVKRELKAAQRELRKDSSFLKSLWLQETQEKDAQRKKKVNKILSDIASDAHAAKMIKRQSK